VTFGDAVKESVSAAADVAEAADESEQDHAEQSHGPDWKKGLPQFGDCALLKRQARHTDEDTGEKPGEKNRK